jgi:hypothetical protein
MGFRTQWYREQEQARQAMTAAKSAARRRRPRAGLTQTWSRMENASVKLADLLGDAIRIMHHPAPGEPAPEISVHLLTDLVEDPPGAIGAPHRAKPVTPMGRRRVGTNGQVETHAELARIEITARLVIYGPADAPPPAEMMRRTWFLPTKTAEKLEKTHDDWDLKITDFVNP